MATIAKLDSNGVQVLPEGRGKTTSPQVHSSTDLSLPPEGILQKLVDAGLSNGTLCVVADKNGQKDDPNEDWCAVCLDGGELMCCDKCPKVFHQNCHIPNISSLPDESETWQCLLCVNLADLPHGEYLFLFYLKFTETNTYAHCAFNNVHICNCNVCDLIAEPIGEKRPGGLSPNELKIIQRICLELYCQYEQSLPLREMEPQTNVAYYEIVCRYGRYRTHLAWNVC